MVMGRTIDTSLCSALNGSCYPQEAVVAGADGGRVFGGAEAGIDGSTSTTCLEDSKSQAKMVAYESRLAYIKCIDNSCAL
jgi:hypothetical protein